MNAKEYLISVRTLDSAINRKLEQLSALKDVVYKTTSTLTPVPGGDHDPKRKEKLMSKIVDMEAEIDAMIDALAELKEEVIGVIYRMKNLYYCKLLENKYVKLQTWEEVAESFGVSARSAYRTGSVALKCFEPVFEEQMKMAVDRHAGVSMVSACGHD